MGLKGAQQQIRQMTKSLENWLNIAIMRRRRTHELIIYLINTVFSTASDVHDTSHVILHHHKFVQPEAMVAIGSMHNNKKLFCIVGLTIFLIFVH